MTEKTKFNSYDEQMDYYKRKLHKLEVSARTAIGRNRKEEIRSEIERIKRLMRVLRKREEQTIQHADMGECGMEEKDESD